MFPIRLSSHIAVILHAIGPNRWTDKTLATTYHAWAVPIIFPSASTRGCPASREKGFSPFVCQRLTLTGSGQAPEGLRRHDAAVCTTLQYCRWFDGGEYRRGEKTFAPTHAFHDVLKGPVGCGMMWSVAAYAAFKAQASLRVAEGGRAFSPDAQRGSAGASPSRKESSHFDALVSGYRVFCPGCHSQGVFLPVWSAWIVRNVSSTERPVPRSLTT